MKHVKDPDESKGAVESGGIDTGQDNAHAPGLDATGMPDDPVRISQDVLGANEDESQG